MYYLLGNRLACKYGVDKDAKILKKEEADNTFLLVLDGDIEFEPQAVDMLVGVLKADRKAGAVCGRIHPKGSGINVFHYHKTLHLVVI